MVEIDKIDVEKHVPADFTGHAFSTYTGFNFFFKEGLIHREDGPAIFSNTGTLKFWCLKGESYTQEEWFEKLTKEQKHKALFNIDEW